MQHITQITPLTDTSMYNEPRCFAIHPKRRSYAYGLYWQLRGRDLLREGMSLEEIASRTEWWYQGCIAMWNDEDEDEQQMQMLEWKYERKVREMLGYRYSTDEFGCEWEVYVEDH